MTSRSQKKVLVLDRCDVIFLGQLKSRLFTVIIMINFKLLRSSCMFPCEVLRFRITSFVYQLFQSVNGEFVDSLTAH